MRKILEKLTLAGDESMVHRTKHIDVRYHFVREYIEDE